MMKRLLLIQNYHPLLLMGRPRKRVIKHHQFKISTVRKNPAFTIRNWRFRGFKDLLSKINHLSCKKKIHTDPDWNCLVQKWFLGNCAFWTLSRLQTLTISCIGFAPKICSETFFAALFKVFVMYFLNKWKISWWIVLFG